MVTRTVRLFDIAANLSDKSFAHDLERVFERARNVGVTKFLLAGLNLQESRHAYQTSLHNENAYCCIGVHPCYANTVDPTDNFEKFEELIRECGNKCVAVGECGLDYDRLTFSDRNCQLSAFPKHFDLAEKLRLPMYLHNRNTGDDFVNLMRTNRDRISGGVVHSFTGSLDELNQLLDMDLYIGVNCCSLKTLENIEIVRHIPIQKIMLETDCPYCEIRKSSPAYQYIKTHFQSKNKEKKDPNCLVRGRNEPCNTM